MQAFRRALEIPRDLHLKTVILSTDFLCVLWLRRIEYFSSSKEQRHAQQKTPTKHYLRGNADKMTLKLMKTQSSTLSFTHVKSAGILS